MTRTPCGRRHLQAPEISPDPTAANNPKWALTCVISGMSCTVTWRNMAINLLLHLRHIKRHQDARKDFLSVRMFDVFFLVQDYNIPRSCKLTGRGNTPAFRIPAVVRSYPDFER